MSDQNIIAFAIVGFGRIGQRHAAIVQGHPAARLVAICDVNEERRKEAEQLGIPCFASLEKLLQDGPTVDVMSICTPNGLHAVQSVQSLQSGHHVLCEKPMALHKADCEAIISAALDASRRVFCVMQNRYSPTITWLKELLESGRLGKTFLVQMNCYWNRDDRYYGHKDWHGTLSMDGGPLFTQFSHFVDLLYWCFGDITDIDACFDNFNHTNSIEFEDSGLVRFRFPSGGRGTIQYSTSVWDRNFESSITIIGEKGTVKIGGQYMDRLEYCHIDQYTPPQLPPSNPPNDYGPYQGSAANHHYVIENVVEVLNGNGAISTNALQGLKVVEIIERIYAQRELK